MPESILEESVFTDEDIEALMKALYEKAVPQTNRYFIDPVTGAVIVVP